MPELPDIAVYLEALQVRTVGQILARVRVLNPFVLRSVAPPIEDANGRRVVALRRLGKRVVFELEDELFLVIHLMVAGRFRWLAAGAKLPGRLALAMLDFASGSLALTEAGTKRRASLHLLKGAAALAAMDPGGIEVLDADLAGFARQLRSANHAVKRALTNPHLFSGIGNAYSDEILHAARLSPFRLTSQLSDPEIATLHEATQRTLRTWTEKLRTETGDRFPEKVTAFRKDMAVHGRYGLPCPDCGAPVQRIVYADNETNYCARCQTGGKILADRALSRLLHDSWPKHIDEVD